MWKIRGTSLFFISVVFIRCSPTVYVRPSFVLLNCASFDAFNCLCLICICLCFLLFLALSHCMPFPFVSLCLSLLPCVLSCESLPLFNYLSLQKMSVCMSVCLPVSLCVAKNLILSLNASLFLWFLYVYVFLFRVFSSIKAAKHIIGI